jgi:hypothetical protein
MPLTDDEHIVNLIRLAFTPKAAENIALYARRLARQRPELAAAIHPLLPPVNPLRAVEAPPTEGRNDG